MGQNGEQELQRQRVVWQMNDNVRAPGAREVTSATISAAGENCQLLSDPCCLYTTELPWRMKMSLYLVRAGKVHCTRAARVSVHGSESASQLSTRKTCI